MPFYDYKCDRCEQEFRRLVKVSEYETPQPCGCGGVGKRLISAPAYVVVKGPLHKKMRY